MDVPKPSKPVAVKRLLPYWAVFQVDLRQTLRSWTYRTWVLAWVLAAVGYLLYRTGIQHEAGIIQEASRTISDVLRWTIVGSVTLIVVLTAGSISGERGTMADSILSRGISRYQYFLAKWHARLVGVLGTFFLMGAATLTASYFLLYEDLSPVGSLVALGMIASLLTLVITCGVTVSALCHSTLLGIAVLWLILYGAGVALSIMPASGFSPQLILERMPNVLRGLYSVPDLIRLTSWAAAVSVGVATFGLVVFARKDV